jgi:hypothetical protein
VKSIPGYSTAGSAVSVCDPAAVLLELELEAGDEVFGEPGAHPLPVLELEVVDAAAAQLSLGQAHVGGYLESIQQKITITIKRSFFVKQTFPNQSPRE